MVDDEDTIEEEEKLEGEANHKEELEDLQAEGEVPIEELLKKYAGAYDEDFEMPQSSEESEMDSDDESDDGMLLVIMFICTGLPFSREKGEKAETFSCGL